MNTNVHVFSKSMKDIETDCMDIAKSIIGGGYSPDLIVFIAQSGFLFAKPMADLLDCELAGITVKRPGNEAKNAFHRFVGRIPQKLLFAILKSRFLYGFNDKHEEREAVPSEHLIRLSQKGGIKKILLVDDSTDTGLSLLKAKSIISGYFPYSEIRTFCYCVITLSEKRIKTDYMKYRDTVVVTATSRYSKEHDAFLSALSDWNQQDKEEAV